MLVAGKDLRIEARSRVTAQQILPFGLVVLLLFAFALDPDRGVLSNVAPGLFWVTVLLGAPCWRSVAAYASRQTTARVTACASRVSTARRCSSGRRARWRVELTALEALLAAGVVILFNVGLGGIAPLLLSTVAATVGLAAAGTLYGVLSAGLRVRETLLPVLLLPVRRPGVARGDSGMGVRHQRCDE